VRHRPPAIAVALAALVLTVPLGGCGDTLQDRPIGARPFESVIVKSHFPVYWMGLRFSSLQVTGVTIDPGGAVTIQYGDCVIGGQYTCVTPLSIVTSPDNSFVPGGSATASPLRIRGVRAMSRQGGATIIVSTGEVVVSVYARRPSLALAAALTMTPLNQAGLPEVPLPKPLPDTGFDRIPLPSELPAGATVPPQPPAR
jgi:hypothetical protein